MAINSRLGVLTLLSVAVVTLVAVGGAGVALSLGEGSVSTTGDSGVVPTAQSPAPAPPPGPDLSNTDLTPPDSALPKARPRPTLADATSAAGHGIDVAQLQKAADAIPSMNQRTSTFGQLPGQVFVDLVWGDVENYEQGTDVAGPNAVILRFVKYFGTGDARYFELVSVDAATGQPLASNTSVIEGSGRPDGFTVDLPGTRWAE
jgi:hypothetical protein